MRVHVAVEHEGACAMWSAEIELKTSPQGYFDTAKVKKRNVTFDLSSLGIMHAPGLQVLTYRPQILQQVRIFD